MRVLHLDDLDLEPWRAPLLVRLALRSTGEVDIAIPKAPAARHRTIAVPGFGELFVDQIQSGHVDRWKELIGGLI